MFSRKNNKIHFSIKRHLGSHLATLFSIGLVLACLTGAIFAPTAYAAYVPEVIFTVKQSLMYDGVPINGQPKTVFTYRLSPKTALAPMPEDCDSDSYTFIIEGASDKTLLPIEYDTPGVFVYELSCISKSVPDYIIDNRTYIIEEYVSDDLQISTVIYGEEGVKMASLAFAHTYLNNIDSENTNRPGSGSNNVSSNRPGSPSSQGKPGKTSVLSSPSTGDLSNPALWMMIVVISCALLLLIIFVERKTKERQKQ